MVGDGDGAVHVWVFTSTHHGNIRVARHCGECDAMTTHQQCPWFYRVLVSRILVSLKEGGFCLCVCAEVVGAARIDTHCGWMAGSVRLISSLVQPARRRQSV